jgi:hydroxyacylglutathione hydrolase
MIQKIKPNIWKFSFKKFGSHVYLLKLKNKNIIIDTSSFENIDELESDLKKLKLKPKDIDIIILTHNHPDHIGGISVFQNAKIYGSKKDFPNDKVTDIKKLKIPELKIIETPGHTKGGICILYDDILFSGDTLFHRGTRGRTDVPGSNEKEMKESLKKLSKINYKILCPGHGSEEINP